MCVSKPFHNPYSSLMKSVYSGIKALRVTLYFSLTLLVRQLRRYSRVVLAL